MRKRTLLNLVAVCWLSAVSSAMAQSPPPGLVEVIEGIERVPFVPGTRIAPEITMWTELEESGLKVIYNYKVTNGVQAEQKIKRLCLVHQGDPHSAFQPNLWREIARGAKITPIGEYGTFWGGAPEADMIAPGTTLEGFGLRTSTLPGATQAYLQGDYQLLSSTQSYEDQKAVLRGKDNHVVVPTVAPMVQTNDHPTPTELADRLEAHWQEAEELGWLPLNQVTSQDLFDFLATLRSESPPTIVARAQDLVALLENEQPGTNGLALIKPTLEYAIARWSAPPPPISLNLTLHSKHVMPHRNQRVELEATPSAPANLVFTLYRVANRNLPNDLGEPVYTETATGVSSSYTFTWEGQTTTGEPAHNGNYELVVAAGEASQSVSVQLNRQQGKQSWLKFGTRTLAYLGHSTLIASVGYALLPGVHWLASLGGPAAGEKVALEG